MLAADPIIGQIAIPRVEQMPNIPRQFKVRDWRQVALDLDAYIFDLSLKGPCLPLAWIDKSRVNFNEDTYGIYPTVGDPRSGPLENGGQYHDSVCDMPALIGPSLLGIDKSNQHGRDWVAMSKAYFHEKDGCNVFLEYTRDFSYKLGGGMGIDFWYDTLPSLMFTQLYYLYLREAQFEELMHRTSEQFYKAVLVLKDDAQKFHLQSFDFAAMKRYDGTKEIHWVEPDSSAAFAWQQMMAHAKFGEAKYLEAAKASLDALNAETKNPLYDCLLPFGAYAAARMNAEHGTDYDTGKILSWCFDGGSIWLGGVSAAQWGDYDIGGITTQSHDRPYLFETFHMASSLVPLTRYEPRLARAVGKWMLNAASNARLFYSGEIPDEYQIVPELKEISRNVIAYELLLGRGVKKFFPAEDTLLEKHKGASFVAARDLWESWSPATGQKYVFPPASNFSLYSSTSVGIFGAIISRTDDEKILQLDCLKTDYFHAAAYPTHLYFNPYTEDREIRVDTGPKRVDLYDAVSKRWLKKGAAGKTAVRLTGDSAAMIVQVPSGAKLQRIAGKLLANGVVVDFRS
jgi:hypothetical protein